MHADNILIEQTRRWLEEVVIGLNLCPFARRPLQAGQIHFEVTHATDAGTLLTDLHLALTALDNNKAIDTTLLIIPGMLADFEDYNDFLSLCDALLERFEWEGVYQVASFHPHYQFEDTEPADAENRTNRSPWPMLHLLREDSVSEALAHYPDPEQIPQRNIARMQALTADELARLDALQAQPST
ncbi:hypothetical protein S7S_12625 [Isoalcanivorax pacificus W11-5]|uniref:Uncharacterized protein n=1 Tax=Isoalcanivorax pacificus W11-5 TaxID=391936 RepID=A0A0B4XRR5_9GAMM|nr:DUF1415 domain-containing protein [Isoalcanivorax pacificus]AJD48937.1 hypothetical protein S7S_12625 [Isoalcanivorax pacificus W11-5]